MGDIIFFTIKGPGRLVSEARGLWLADRVFNCPFVFSPDADDDREVYQKIADAIVSGLQGISAMGFEIKWRILPPWKVDE